MAFKADLLRKKLKEEGKSRDELAAAIKKHKRTVSRWLAGTNPPKPKDLEAIARVLNCKPQDFDPFFADMGLGEVSIQAHVSASALRCSIIVATGCSQVSASAAICSGEALSG